jgi:hypothetical protein
MGKRLCCGRAGRAFIYRTFIVRPLTTPELLRAWEHGLNRPLMDRSLYLLRAASTAGETEAAALSIGQRDARLLQLREWMFGPRLANTAICPHCAERVEWENDVQDLRLQPVVAAEAAPAFELEADGFHLSFRLPTSADITALDIRNSGKENSDALLQQCVLGAHKDGIEYNASTLPPHVLHAMEERMSREDAQADITLLLNCPACSQQWESRFDILGYLWSEINAWAMHILQEVYLLAKAFGWSEQDILNMSPQRRRLYLEMLRA